MLNKTDVWGREWEIKCVLIVATSMLQFNEKYEFLILYNFCLETKK